MARNGDPSLVALLAIRSLNMQYTPAGDAVLTGVTSLQTPPMEFAGHTDATNGLDISPDGKLLATGGADMTVRLWDIASGKTLHVFSGFTDSPEVVAFSPDGRYLVSASNDITVRMWDVATGRELRRFAGQPGRVFGAAFSPDGKYVISSGEDGTARLWDVATGQEPRRFTGHGDIVRQAVFSPDGRYILTASQDNTARLWLTNLHDTVRAVCALLPRDLSAQERLQFGIADTTQTCPAP